jgi:hypothetical protein
MQNFKLPFTFKNRLEDAESLNEINLALNISFYTSGQVKFTDSNGRSKIIEFFGSNWSIDLLLKKGADTSFSVFINNPKKTENQILTLTKKINTKITADKTFEISIMNDYDGWFKLD